MLYDCKGRPYEIIKLKNGRDVSGQTYKFLTYLYRIKRLDKNDKNHSYWLAQCKCGNVIIIRNDRLFNTSSCGCLSKINIKKSLTLNLTNQRFGKLTALYQVENKKKEVYWHCKCNCGNEKNIQRAALTSGAVKSCGCIVSVKEEEIQKILIKNNISFIRQYRIKECKDKLPLPFDFAVFEKERLRGLIEYQGSQHFKQSTQWDTKEDFETRKQHDIIKQEYCKSHNIPLLILTKDNILERDIVNFLLNEKVG